jgi:hypothetical protein
MFRLGQVVLMMGDEVLSRFNPDWSLRQQEKAVYIFERAGTAAEFLTTVITIVAILCY